MPKRIAVVGAGPGGLASAMYVVSRFKKKKFSRLFHKQRVWNRVVFLNNPCFH
ncbi:hypothetical protein RG959_12535 [Domibacillus sp. 8LH]|uniref:hypothetical protein n=1 Tax=Domibacillus sp. 8LH TaxID=3073900 RepID=UPI00317F634A